MSPDSATSPLAFATSPLPLSATFDGGRLTSDGGLPWLGEADAALGGLCEAMAACGSPSGGGGRCATLS